MKSRSRALAICVAAACLGACLLASPALAVPKPAWEPIAASGPTNLPPVQSEIQRVSVDAEGGNYTLTQTTATGNGVLSGATFSGNLTAGSDKVTGTGFLGIFTVSGELAVGQEILGPGIPAGTTIVAIGEFFGFPNQLTLSANAEATAAATSMGAGSKTVTGVSTTSGTFSVGADISATGIPAGTTIAAVGSGTLTLSKIPTQSGSRALTASGTTASIPFNASASQLEAALNAVPAISGAGVSVTVSGGPGDKGATNPYFVTFGGSLADTGVPQMTAASGELTGGDTHTVTVTTALNGGPGTTTIAIYPQNVGGAPSSGETTLSFSLPAGVTTTATPHSGPKQGTSPPWVCQPIGAGQSSGICKSNEVVGPGITLVPVEVPVTAAPGATGGPVHVEVSGGGAVGTATYDMSLVVSAIAAPPGIQAFTAATYDEFGQVDTRAGAHPYSASTGILINSVRSPHGKVVPAGEFRDILVDTPPGFFGNPIATPQCPEDFEQENCEQASIVATAQVPLILGSFGEISTVNNIEAPFGNPAKFRFLTGFDNVIVNVLASLRSDQDYGLEVGSYNTPQIKTVFGAFFTIWGSPLHEGHDEMRCKIPPGNFNPTRPVPAPIACKSKAQILAEGGKEVAFLTNPVDCAEEALRSPVATLRVNTWQNPTLLFSHDAALEPVTECDKLKFEADFGFEPTSAKTSDSPASFRTELSVPTGGLVEPDKLMNPTIKESVVELPKGVVLNASAADGLAACTKEQIGLIGTNQPRPNEIRFTKDPNTCPDASKIGSGELKSELIEEPLQVDLFLAAQGDGNPFGSLFAIYLVIEDPRNGIFVKLPGEVQVNEADGQQRVVFRDLPPLPFTYLKLNLKGGSRSPLATPTTCGSYATTATNTPWSAPESGPPHVSGNSFAVDRGPNGMPCANSEAERPFQVGLSAGSDNPVAGAKTPFQIQVTRPDGNQELDRLEISPPPGFVASLKGIPYCSEGQISAASARTGKAEQASPSCPAASQVGTTNSGAGSGPSPFYAPGKLYLSGPYKGAPLSVVAITPAVGGPFDLGNVVVRSALRVDPKTARITAVTDPLPRILKGVPLRIRDVRVNLDRSNWAQNPTSCEAMAVDVTAHGSNGAVSKPSNRFQVGGCESLGFKPRLLLSLKGGTKRGDNPALKAVVRPRPGDANIAGASVTLPRSAFLDQAHIRTICTRVQFAADQCPKAAIYGRAEAITPLLDEPLSGPVYLRSSDNELPDLVADLRGPANQPIKIEAAFRTDSIRGGIRSTLDLAPDAAVTKFTLQMQGGRKGLVVNSQNLCANTNRAKARFTGHNGRRFVARPAVKALGCKEQKRKGKKSRGERRR